MTGLLARTPEELGYAVGRLLGAFFLPAVLIIVIFWLIARKKRSRKPWTRTDQVVISLLVGLALVLLVGGIVRLHASEPPASIQDFR